MVSGPSGPHGVIYLRLHRGTGDCALLQHVLKSLTRSCQSQREDASLAMAGRGMDLLSSTGPLGSTVRSHAGLFGHFAGQGHPNSSPIPTLNF